MRDVALALLLFAPQESSIPADWIDLLVPAASIDPDDRARARATLEKAAGPQRDSLRKLGRDGSDEAAVLAGLLGEKDVRGTLLRLLKSDKPVLRRAAAEALGVCGGDSGVSDLASRLDDADLHTALACARTLGRMKTKSALAALTKGLDAKNERRSLIAAAGLEIAEPGSQLTLIRTRLTSASLHDTVFAVATNCPSVWEALNRAIDKQFKRDESLKLVFEKDDFKPETRDALGTLCVRGALMNPADCLAYLRLPAVKVTPWAVDRVPRLGGMRKSYVAFEIVKILEGLATKKTLDEGEEKHAAALEKILQTFCGSKVPQGEFADRAKEYREWYDRVWTTLIDADVYGAIDDGVAWLKKRQHKDGGWYWCECGFEVYANIHHEVGTTSLCGYTLLKMDVPHDDPAVTKAAAFVLDIEVPKVTDDPTYSLSLEAMFLAELVQRAKGKKGDKGTKAGLDAALEGRLHKRIQECVDWLIEARVLTEKGGYDDASWTYTKPVNKTSHDHSNSQFAVLGLLAGQNAGAKVPAKVWSSIFNHWKGTQYKEGGWYYTPLAEGTPETSMIGSMSMTGAGLSSILVSEAALKNVATEKVAQTQEATKRAMAKWAKTYPIPAPARNANHGHVFSIYYDLYSLERSMMLGGFLKIGEKDWYHDGALYILYNQMHNGAWLDTTDTCFALLFLKKAYIAVATGGDK